MACALTAGKDYKACKTVAGTKAFLITEFANITAITKTAGVVTAMTQAGSTVFFRYKMAAQVGSWKQDTTSNKTTGTYGLTTEATMPIQGIDQATQTELGLLIKNKLMLIAEENDGTYWLLGEDFGMDVTTDALVGGTNMADFRGNTITFQGDAYTRVCEVNSGIIAGLLS